VSRRPHVLVGIAVVLGMAFLYLPLASIVLNAFNGDQSLISWGGFSLRWFREVLADPDFIGALVSSLIIGVIVGALSVAIALLAALGRRSRTTDVFDRIDDRFVLLRMLLPEVAVVMALFLGSRVLEVPLGVPLVILSETTYCSAYAFLVIRARLSQLSTSYEYAARDLGAPGRSTLFRVVMPLIAPSLLVSFLLTFTFSLDDVLSPTFLGGPDVQTVPTMVLGLVRHGVTAEVNAIAVTVMVVSLIPLFAAMSLVGIRQIGLAQLGGRNQE
jgi:ABC-type spermidine/putrescine transport system permease subunit II